MKEKGDKWQRGDRRRTFGKLGMNVRNQVKKREGESVITQKQDGTKCIVEMGF